MSCPKFGLTVLFFACFFLLFAKSAHADKTIDSATLNGSTSVTVAPSTSITAAVNVTTTTIGGASWLSTNYSIDGGSSVCVDTSDHTSAGTYTESFSITAPSSTGTHSISFIAYTGNACNSTTSNTFTLSSGIIVASPTSTPAPTSSTPGATATPTSSSGGSSSGGSSSSSSTSTSTTSNPSPSISVSPLANPTNKTKVAFSGKATVDQGSIATVEFSITDGAEWISAQASDGSFNSKEESFTFTTPTLSEGTRTIKVRSKSQAGVSSETSVTVTIVTTPPVVTLDTLSPNPTSDTTPTITGKAGSSLGTISKIEISIDGGKTWLATKATGTFSLTTEELEDGNYQIITRATDNAGNIGLSKTQTLIVDTIPPIIGGGMLTLGPQILVPDENGTIVLTQGTETLIAISMKGGVTKAKIVAGNQSFTLKLHAGTNLWTGKLLFNTPGIKTLKIEAHDGADNKTTRAFNTVFVDKSAVVKDKKTGQIVKDAKVYIYVYETSTRQWVLWDGPSYGQKNPQEKLSDGFMLPPGKYYLEVKAPGYYTVQSQILTFSETTPLNSPIAMERAPGFILNLPFVGQIRLFLPSFAPPKTIAVAPKAVDKSSINQVDGLIAGSQAPDFNLPTLDNKKASLKNYKGKKLVLTFLSSWSPLSLEQAAALSRVNRKNADTLTIFLQESTAATQTFMKRGAYTFPAVADNNGEAGTDYKINILPTHFFIDAEGKIYRMHTGVLTKEAMVEIFNNMP